MHKRYVVTAGALVIIGALTLARCGWESCLDQSLRSADHERIARLLPSGPVKWVRCDVESARRYLMSPFGNHPWEPLARMRAMATMSGNGHVFDAVVWNMAHSCSSVADVAMFIAKVMAEDGVACPSWLDVWRAARVAPLEVTIPIGIAWLRTHRVLAGPLALIPWR